MAVYLDNAATSYPKPEAVYGAVDATLRRVGASPGRGGYDRSLEASRLLFTARETVASFFGLSDSSRVIFTHSATESLNLAVNGLLRPGDHVVTTTMEHNSLVRPLGVAERHGVEVTRVPADARGYVSAASIASALRPSTRLVALAHCSNVTGTIQPVGEIGSLARAAGAFFLVDAAQSAGSLPIDMQALRIDLLAAPGHKGLLGPPGTGVLLLGPGVEPTPLIVGGTGGFSSSEQQPDSLPERLESGTPNTPGIAGLLAGVEFIQAAGVETIMLKEQSLVEAILSGLAAMPAVTVHGPAAAAARTAVVSFTVAGRDPAEIGFLLDREHGISVRAGLQCAVSAHRTIGTYPAGTVRVSPGYFTTDEDIRCFLHALGSLISSSAKARCV